MKLKVYYITDADGKTQAVKIDIDDWNYLQQLLQAQYDAPKEGFEIIETPIEVKKIETKPKGRTFSDFIMDI